MLSAPTQPAGSRAPTAGPEPAPEVLARLRTAPTFAAGPLLVEDLPGGLTNHNVKVTTADGVYVARLSDPSGAMLSIDRHAEYLNSVAAAAAGAAPEVVDHVPEAGLLVVRWVEGRTFTPDDVRRPENLPRIAAACRTLHAGPRFTGDFDMFAVRRAYLDVVLRHGFRLPPRYRDFEPALEEVRRALAVRAVGTVPCNNDLLAANMIDDGDRIWLIDYEYAGNNDACFELGNIWSESELEPEALDALVTAYDGRALRHRVARARLYALVARYGWTLWASIQDGVSPLDVDYWSWGTAKYESAVAEFEGPGLRRLLEDAVRDD